MCSKKIDCPVLFPIHFTQTTSFTSSGSKKDAEIRRCELLESISPALLSYLQGHAQELVLDKSACVLVSGILGAATGDVQPAMEAIATLAADPLHPGGKDGEVTCRSETGSRAAEALVRGNLATEHSAPQSSSSLGNGKSPRTLETLALTVRGLGSSDSILLEWISLIGSRLPFCTLSFIVNSLCYLFPCFTFSCFIYTVSGIFLEVFPDFSPV